MSQRLRTLSLPGLLAAALLALAAATASAQQPVPACPTVQAGQELRELPSLYPANGLLSTTFRVEIKRQCVPVFNGNWVNTPMNLRTYVWPSPDGALHWGFPGPTLHLRKPSTTYATGDSLAILLVNNLPAEASDKCDSACPAGTVCPTDPAQLPDPNTCHSDPLCCCWVNRSQSHPNCFHGDNTTNLHFHGMHVSPQSPQDFVLLELHPGPTPTDPPPPGHAGGLVAYGQFQYRVDPLHFTQSEGTFWYHPHKHGSVGLQVANGMPGTLLVEGPFDDWLKALYNGNLKEKILFLQQLQESLNLYAQGVVQGLLVNGQASPVVTMAPGEVQRWRFVNATLQASAQISIYFPAQTTVRQIAQDGIQFAPENYARQPLFDPTNPSVFRISPGNRADFLVQAPTIAGSYPVNFEIFGNLSERASDAVRQRQEGQRKLAGGKPPALVTLVVKAPEKGTTTTVATGLPADSVWPPLPFYLRDIGDNEVAAKRGLQFSMSAGPGNPTTRFLLNGKQFSHDCDDVTTALGAAEQWKITNTSVLEHPFHIHTNPFQLLKSGSTVYSPPWVWMDTTAIPGGSVQTPGETLMRQRYEEFTGGYVLHCHFLGHEDRGMMFGTQTVCPQNPLNYGQAHPGLSPECVAGNLIPAIPRCPAITTAGGESQ